MRRQPAPSPHSEAGRFGIGIAIENRDTHWKRHSGSRLITKLDIGIKLREIFSPDEVNPLVEWVYMR